jgi:hypothetical protein
MNTEENNTQLPQSSVSVSAGLSGKAKVDFEKWLDNQNVAPYKVMFYDIPKIVQHAYIIEWLDSVEIYVDCGFYANGRMCSGLESTKYELGFRTTGTKCTTRQEAINYAITEAVKIYNTEAEH